MINMRLTRKSEKGEEVVKCVPLAVTINIISAEVNSEVSKRALDFENSSHTENT